MSFQSDAYDLKSKLHMSGVKTPVLVTICVGVLLVLFLLFQGLAGAFSSSSFEVIKQETKASSKVSSNEQGQESSAGFEEASKVYVHVGGAVVQAGVIGLPEDARVTDAIEKAGGFAENAATQSLNLARRVQDGEQIMVPTQDEYRASLVGASVPISGSGEGGSVAAASMGRVNINSATQAELETLSGIGASTAKKIIAYRESNGSFKTIEDLKNVSGIGDKKYTDLAGKICV